MAFLRSLSASGTLSAAVTLLYFAACNREFNNPSDPEAGRYTVKSQARLERMGQDEIVVGDTVQFFGGLTSEPVLEAGLVKRLDWDFDGDGKVDTVTYYADTLFFVPDSARDYKTKITLLDKAGFKNSTSVQFHVHPSLKAQFKLRKWDPLCPVYAQEPLLMRLALALSQFSVERNKEEGIANSDFVLKIARTLTGSSYPIGALEAFEYSFAKGVYRFRNGDFNLDIAFHYGPGLTGHAEGDTIRANLFDLDSYVRITDINVFPPSVKYARGPLAELIDGDLNLNLDNIKNPKFDFKMDFNRIRFSFSRNTKSPLLLSNQEITLANALFFTLFEGKAKLAPIYPSELIRLYGKDSLELDFSGTRISSPELQVPWPYTQNEVQDTAVYRIGLAQETLHHRFLFGNSGGKNKVSGNYTSINNLGGTQSLESIYFEGTYSSTGADSAKFYCNENLEGQSLFGISVFESAIKNQGYFKSVRFEYEFPFPFSIVEPWNGNLESIKVPEKL